MTPAGRGKTWTDPQPAPAVGRGKQGNSPSEEGVGDVVPEWHPLTKSVLARGHNVFYSGPKFSADQPPRWPIYAVWRDGKWGPRRKLEWPDPRGAYIYSNNCGQRVVLPNGDIQMSFTFGATKGEARAVAGVICGFDGETLTVQQVGEPITNAKGRGLLEPAVTQFQGRFFLPIRPRTVAATSARVTTASSGRRSSRGRGTTARRWNSPPRSSTGSRTRTRSSSFTRARTRATRTSSAGARRCGSRRWTRARCACAAPPSASCCRSWATA